MGGWTEFRPYSPDLWRWLRATYQGVPFMLSSATLSTTSLERIKISLGIDREEVLVLSSSCDRPNIFQQSRRLKRRLDIWNIDRDCAWIFPLLADQRAKLKMQIFVLKKDTADIITAWAQRRAERLAIPNLTPSHIEKLSGDNSREEKDRVIMALRAGGCRLLISTKCAGMGCDVPDIKITVCVGLPKDTWELSQMLGRGGRDGNNAAFVILLWPGQAGGRGQCKELGRVLLEQRVDRQSCQREAINNLFLVESPYKYYSSEPMDVGCSAACEVEKVCICTKCKCCTHCANKCSCHYANVGFDESLQRHLLPLTSTTYHTVKVKTDSWVALEDDEDDEDDVEDEEEEEDEEEKEDIDIDADTEDRILDVIYELF